MFIVPLRVQGKREEEEKRKTMQSQLDPIRTSQNNSPLLCQ